MRFSFLALAPLFFTLLAPSAFAREPVVELYQHSMRWDEDFDQAFPVRSLERRLPLEIRSEEAAREHLSRQFLRNELADINWETSYILVFCWGGSQRDQFNYEMKTDIMPPEATFRLENFTDPESHDAFNYLLLYQIQGDVVWEYID